MNILVWECNSCSSKCILPFTGHKNSCGFERPDACIEDVTCYTDPWILRKVDDERILNYFKKANEKWRNP